MPGFTAPKLAWVRKHEPRVFGRVAKVLLPKDYVRFRLTGEFATDLSDASGTMWLDVARRDWSDVLLDATALDRSHMPALHEGSEATGTLRAEWAGRWGIPGTAVVAAGGGDNAASGCGIGAVKPGAAFVSIGTSGVLFVSNAAFSPNTRGAVHAFCHAVPGTWHQMGVILSAADSLEWLAGVAGKPAPALAGEINRETKAPGPVVFLPYLSGERTPHNDPHATGAFLGLRRNTTLTELTLAVLEGVAYAFRDCQRVLRDAGTDFASAIAVGGGAHSRAWLQILATVLDRPIEVPEQGDFGAAFGAARLALCAAEGANPIDICARPRISHTVNPDPARAGLYEQGYARYRALYPAIKEALTA
jgi:xylulokinase